MNIAPGIDIDERELVEQFIRSPGPGGQHVNRTESAVELRFDVKASPSLPEELRERLLARSDQRLTEDGVMIIRAHRYRSQERNRGDARERLIEWLREGLKVAKPRLATRPSRASRERRLESKQRRGQIKAGRKQDW